MGDLCVRFLTSGGEVLLEKTVPGDPSLLGPGPERAEPAPFKGIPHNPQPMNAATINMQRMP